MRPVEKKHTDLKPLHTRKYSKTKERVFMKITKDVYFKPKLKKSQYLPNSVCVHLLLMCKQYTLLAQIQTHVPGVYRLKYCSLNRIQVQNW